MSNYVKAKLISELGEFKVDMERLNFNFVVNPDESFKMPSGLTKSALQWAPFECFRLGDGQ